MKAFEVINRYNKVKTDDDRDTKKHIWGFEMVTLSVNFFGNIDEFDLDTIIYWDGTQVVKEGNGWIPTGTVIRKNEFLRQHDLRGK